jgi:hypothetical protein
MTGFYVKYRFPVVIYGGRPHSLRGEPLLDGFFYSVYDDGTGDFLSPEEKEWQQLHDRVIGMIKQKDDDRG